MELAHPDAPLVNAVLPLPGQLLGHAGGGGPHGAPLPGGEPRNRCEEAGGCRRPVADAWQLQYLSGPRIYSCSNCRCHIADNEAIESKACPCRAPTTALHPRAIRFRVSYRPDEQGS